ncbi:MAG: hypothetical protein JO189_29665 [Deltaproteobacteria bacterium]|nr:hypothetical protein [Deltaproteobacteria bacterium]
MGAASEKRLRENLPLSAAARPTAPARKSEQLALPLKRRFTALDTRPVVSTADTGLSASNPPDRAESGQIEWTDTQLDTQTIQDALSAQLRYHNTLPISNKSSFTHGASGSDDFETIA